MVPGRIAMVLAWLALIAAFTLAWAQVDRTQQQRLEAELAAGQANLQAQQAEIEAITRALGSTEAALRERVTERDRLSRQLRDLQVQRDDLRAGIATLRRDVASTEAQIADLEGNLAALRERVQGLLVNLHRQRAGGYSGNLGRVDSFHELAVRQTFVGLMAAQDVAVVGELDQVVAQLNAARSTLQAQIATLSERERALAANAQSLELARVALDAVIVDLRTTEAGQQAQQRALLEAQTALLAQVDGIERALATEIARLEAEERRLRAAAQTFVNDRARQAALEAEADAARARIDNLRNPVPAPAAGYVSPLDNSVVISRFGEANNSFVGLRANSAGAAVRAVRAGVVISVAAIGANDGYLVAVRHDATTATVYTNLRPPVVAVGDSVAAGAVLGYLGGGMLIPPDVLRFYVRRTDNAGNSVFVDPGPVLGI